MSGIIVSKYGGSSITSKRDIERIGEITTDDPKRKIVVVSAPGKRCENDTKVTDLLIELAITKNQDIFNEILGRYRELNPGKEHKELSDILNQRISQQLPEDAYIDSIKAFGEEACAKLVAQALNAEYVDPREIILVSDDFGNAKILGKSEQKIKKLAEKRGILVIPGFYGLTRQRQVATFSRGGSDLTGAYIAASLNAETYENFTDRDGILAADPCMVKDPAKILEITYKEMRDLSYSGFKIFHSEAMEPVMVKKIPVHVRNTSKYPAEGTYIVHDRISNPEKPIIGVAYQDGFCSFDIERFGLNEEIGIARKVLHTFEKEGISIEFMPSAIDDISVILKQNQLKNPGSIISRLYSLMGKGSTVTFQENLGCLVVAGKGLRGRRGVSADIQMTLAGAGVNIKFISQASQEQCIVYGISSSDGKKSVNVVYDRYLR